MRALGACAPVDLADQPWIRVEAGTFAIGSPPDEIGRDTDEDRYDNTFTRPWLMLATEVTQSLYTAFSDTNPSHYLGDNAHPVDTVSWYDAVAFCNRLSAAAGLTAAYVINGTDVSWDPDADGYRLPTEAEWEHACRAGTTTRYSAGTTRIFRGGAYSTRLDWCRTAFRNMMDASTVGWNTGFRVVRYAD